MLVLDGSLGEGGGQVLRTALALSVLTKTPFRIENIRGKRKNPGLMRQHLACVQAAATISDASVDGAELRSQALFFIPQDTIPGAYTFSVGSAGSTGLVLQTILPPLWHAKTPSRIKIDGGTHNPSAPPYPFLSNVWIPSLEKMGVSLALELVRHGFYPAGGGRIIAEITPVAEWKPLNLISRGEIKTFEIRSIVSALPENIGRRENITMCQALARPLGESKVFSVENPVGPGNMVWIGVENEHFSEMFCAFGERSLRAESVAQLAINQAKRFFESDVPVGEHLADQLLLPLAFSKGCFRALKPSEHTKTNAHIIEQFLGIRFRMEAESEDSWWIGL